MTPATHYQRIGGEAPLRALATRFYEIMDTHPEAYCLRTQHPADLTESGNKLFEFLSGWMGGPDRFVEKYGPPMLRRRHLPFRVDNEARDQWLYCMRLALEEVVPDAGLRCELYAAFSRVADHMRIQPEAEAA